MKIYIVIGVYHGVFCEAQAFISKNKAEEHRNKLQNDYEPIDENCLVIEELEIEELEKLEQKLEIRKRQLIDGSIYPLNSGHHTRDIITTLAVLNNDPQASKLLDNMPKEEDVIK